MGRLEDYLGVYFITDSRFGHTHEEIAEKALKGGVRAVQFREKVLSTKRMYEIGKRIRELTRDYGALFFVNDRIDVAIAVDADGVHIGQDDMPAEVAREIFPGYIGVSAGSVEEAKKDEKYADYLGVGPVFPTKTKEDAGEAIGIEGLRKIVESVKVPVVAIGSIKRENAVEVLKTGVVGIAVISAIAASEDPERAARELIELVKNFKSKQ